MTSHMHMYSPMGFYFVSGSHDRTARVWSTEQIQPVRILAGHLSDVDVSTRTATDCSKYTKHVSYSGVNALVTLLTQVQGLK